VLKKIPVARQGVNNEFGIAHGIDPMRQGQSQICLGISLAIDFRDFIEAAIPLSMFICDVERAICFLPATGFSLFAAPWHAPGDSQ
jgi:hypothetical protein